MLPLFSSYLHKFIYIFFFQLFLNFVIHILGILRANILAYAIVIFFNWFGMSASLFYYSVPISIYDWLLSKCCHLSHPLRSFALFVLRDSILSLWVLVLHVSRLTWKRYKGQTFQILRSVFLAFLAFSLNYF